MAFATFHGKLTVYGFCGTLALLLGSIQLPAQTATYAPPSSPPKPPELRVTGLMSPEDFKACGLDKLSKEEQAKLDNWLRRYTLSVMDYTAKRADGRAASSGGGVIESQIDGEFEGWSGDTVFKLTNGQVWQQAAYAYSYHYAYRPKVMIYKGDEGYMMKVEDVDDAIHVKLISDP